MSSAIDLESKNETRHREKVFLWGLVSILGTHRVSVTDPEESELSQVVRGSSQPNARVPKFEADTHRCGAAQVSQRKRGRPIGEIAIAAHF